LRIEIPQEEFMISGHLACPGCGAALSMRFALKALGKKTIVVIPASCWTIIAGPFPYSSLKVPIVHCAFETGGATGAGIKAALQARGDVETTVMVWAGDGGTFDIGLQSLSGAAERNDDFIYVCYDNEAYMNTGIQRSSATPYLSWTTTSPANQPKENPKKDIMEIMAAHRVPYAASATIAYPQDFVRKLQKAKEIRGFKFIHLLSPCPPGWRIDPELSIKISRLAVQSKVFPLYEVEGGERYTINLQPKGILVNEYIRLQGRFSHLSEEEIEMIQENVDRGWERLIKKASGW